MSDSSSPDPSAAAGPGASAMPHAGAVVRAAREARGQTLLHLSILLKISERRLQAFEEGRWSDVGDRTFVRALAQSLCKHLHLDPQPVLQSLPAVAAQPHAQPDRGRLTEAGAPSLKSLRRPAQMPGAGAGLLTPVRLGVAAILACALGLAFAPAEWWATTTKQEAPVAQAPVEASAPAAPVAGVPDAAQAPASEPVAGVAVGAVTPSQASVSVPTGSAPRTGQAVASPSPTTSITPNSSVSPPPSAPGVTPVAAPSNSPLQLQATQDTWVQVTDSKGTVVFSRLLRTGERVGLEGARPLRLRVGNVAGTEVVWQGRRVALEDTQRNNVADVELP